MPDIDRDIIYLRVVTRRNCDGGNYGYNNSHFDRKL